MLCKKKYLFFQIFFVLLLYRLGVSRSFSMFKFNYTGLFDVFIYATRIQKGSKMHFKFWIRIWIRIRPNFLDPTGSGSGSTTLLKRLLLPKIETKNVKIALFLHVRKLRAFKIDYLLFLMQPIPR